MDAQSEIAKRRTELQKQKEYLQKLREKRRLAEERSQTTPESPFVNLNHIKSQSAVITPQTVSVNLPPRATDESGKYTSPSAKVSSRKLRDSLLGEDGYRPGTTFLPTSAENANDEAGESGEDTVYKKCPLKFVRHLSHEHSDSRRVTAIEFHRKYEDVFFSAHAKRAKFKPGAVNGIVCVWSMQPSSCTLQRSLHCQSAVSALLLPILSPTVVIAGTVDGQVLTWDTRVKSPLPTSSFANDGTSSIDFHDRYPVTAISSTSSSSQYFLTTSSGGHICKWSLAKPDFPIDKVVVPDYSGAGDLAIECLDFPQTARLYGDELGANNRSTTFFVGTQDGDIYRMEGSASEWKPIENERKHLASVSALRTHPLGAREPFLDDTLLSASRDWTISLRYYPRGQNCEELLAYDMIENGGVYDVDWSCTHSSVFCTANESGSLSLFDVSGTMKPVGLKRFWNFNIPDIEISPMTSVKWDRNGRFVCAGDCRGNIGIWETCSSFAGLPNEVWTAQYLRSKLSLTS